MINSLISTTICCVVCHGGPADHFATFIPELQKAGAQVHVHATPGVIGKFKDLEIEIDTLHVSDASLSEIDVARNLAKKCSKVSVLLTDLGSSFTVSLQKTFNESNPQVKRLVYYDNPESYVPGGYSDIANKTMQLADRVLFCNANLACNPIYINEKEESSIPFEKRYGIGYYPINRIKKIRESRLKEQQTNSMRKKFFDEYRIQGENKKILVYFGGNNEEYYQAAFPAFQNFLIESTKRMDLSHLVFVIHQHPAAKNNNRDWNIIKGWVEEIKENSKAPTLVLSHWDSNQMQQILDCALYWQTSMAAQFLFHPRVQVGDKTYKDVLIENGLAHSVTTLHDFIETIVKGNYETSQNDPESLIIKCLGFRNDYNVALIEAIK